MNTFLHAFIGNESTLVQGIRVGPSRDPGDRDVPDLVIIENPEGAF